MDAQLLADAHTVLLRLAAAACAALAAGPPDAAAVRIRVFKGFQGGDVTTHGHPRLVGSLQP